MYITRDIEKNIVKRLFKGKIIIIYGPRQVGKTTLVKKIIEEWGENVLFLNGDEQSVRSLLENKNSTELKNIIGGHKIVFIDEAQRVENIGLTLKIIHDQIDGVQVIASGSSSFEIANQIKEPLTGRKYEFYLFPFSHNELANHTSLFEEKRNLSQRLIYGSYPDIVNHPSESKLLLNSLAGSYLYKDLLTMENIKKPSLLDKILRAIALQLGSEVKFNEIAQLVGADNQTVEKYIDLLEKAYVIFRLPALSRNVRNEIKKSRKIYFYDNGIRNAIINNYNMPEQREDIGALWENFLVSERIKFTNYNEIFCSHYFWRTRMQQEIDYIEEENGKFRTFEFKWNTKAKANISKTFTSNYPLEKFEVVTPNNYNEFLSAV